MKWRKNLSRQVVAQYFSFLLAVMVILSSVNAEAGNVSSGDAMDGEYNQVGQASSGDAIAEKIILSAQCEGIQVELIGDAFIFPQGELELCVSLLGTDENISSDLELDVQQAKETLDIIAEEQKGDVLEQILFDIRLLCNGEEIQPQGSVEVRFCGILETEEEEAQIYHIDDDGIKTEKVSSEIEEDGILSMEVEHFSIYGIVVTQRVSEDVALGHFSGAEDEIPEPIEVNGGSSTPYNRLDIHYMESADAEVLAYNKIRTDGNGRVCLEENVPNNLENDPTGGNPFHGHWDDVYIDEKNTAVNGNVYQAFGSDCPGAIGFQFAGSNRNARNYATNPDAGWDASDLSLETTEMWIQIRYKNIGTFNGKFVGADMMLRVTPYKNRTRYDGGYSWAEAGVGYNYGGIYYPTIQISKCLAQGWVWQNVREFDVELQFFYMDNTNPDGTPRGYLDLQGAGEKGYESFVAEYYTIHSLNPTFIRPWEYPAHNHGPEYVLPRTMETNAWTAYVYNGRTEYGHDYNWNSHIKTSYQDPGYNATDVPTQLKRSTWLGGRGWPTVSKSYPLTYAYCGGSEAWNGDSPGRDNWLQNSVIIMPEDTTNTWAFTLGNLLRYPDGKVSTVENDRGTQLSESPGGANQGIAQITRYPQGTYNDPGWDHDYSTMAVNNTVGVPRTDLMWAAMSSDPFNKSKLQMSILQLMKVSEEENNKPLQGAVFELTNEENIVIDNLQTDEQGLAYFYLPHDMELLLQETKPPEGYQMMEINSWKVYATDESVTITEVLPSGLDGTVYVYEQSEVDDEGIHNVYQFNVKNKKKAGLSITKVDEATGQALEGVEFHLIRTGIKNWSADDKDGLLSVELTADSYDAELSELSQKNMALNVRAFASSTLTSVSVAEAVTDGNPGSGWESALPGAMVDGTENSEDQWLIIDLGSSKTIDFLKVYWGENYASKFQVQIADEWNDDTEWQDIAFERSQGAVYTDNIYSHMPSAGGVQIIEFPSEITARFIKIYCMSSISPEGTYEIGELEIWGKSGSAVLLRHEDTGENTWGSIYQTLYLTTNNEYTLSFYAKVSGTFIVKVMNSDWSLLDEGTEWYFSANESDGYQQYTVTFSIPQKEVSKQETVIMLGDSTGEFVYYDNVTLYLGNYTSNLLSNSDFEENENQSRETDENGMFTFENLSVGTYSLRETVASSGYLLPEHGWMVDINSSDSNPLEMIVTINGENVTRTNTEQPADNIWDFVIANQRGILLRKLGVSEDGEDSPLLSGVAFDLYQVVEGVDNGDNPNLIVNGDFSNGENNWWADKKGTGWSSDVSTVDDSQSDSSIVTNGGFEADLSGWDNFDNSAKFQITEDPEHIKSGSKALFVESASQDWVGLTQDVFVEPNTTYEFSFWAQNTSMFCYKIMDSGWSSNLVEQYPTGTGEYQQYTGTFNSGENTKVIFYISDAEANGYYDDFIITKVVEEEPELEFDGGLVDNGSFEGDLTGWNNFDNSAKFQITEDPEHIKSGSKALFVESSSQDWVGLTQDVFVEPNTTYEFSFWAQNTSMFCYKIMDSGWSSNLVEQYPTGTGEYQQYTGTFNSGENTKVIFYISDAATNGYYDDFAITKVVEEEISAGISFNNNQAKIVTMNAEQKYSGIVQTVSIKSGTEYILSWKVKGEGQLLVKASSEDWSETLNAAYQDITDEENYKEWSMTFNSDTHNSIVLQFAQNADQGVVILDDLSLTEVRDVQNVSQIPGAPEGIMGTRTATVLTNVLGEASLAVSDGEYYLVETKTNTGYQLLDDAIYMKIEGGEVTEISDNRDEEMAVLKKDEGTDMPVLQITNLRIFEMPETGGYNWAYPLGCGIMQLSIIALFIDYYIVHKRRLSEGMESKIQ